MAALQVAGAVLGSYVVTALATAWLARVLPLATTEAVFAATLSSFALYAILVMVAIAMRSVLRLWLGLLVASALLAVALWRNWP